MVVEDFCSVIDFVLCYMGKEGLWKTKFDGGDDLKFIFFFAHHDMNKKKQI